MSNKEKGPNGECADCEIGAVKNGAREMQIFLTNQIKELEAMLSTHPPVVEGGLRWVKARERMPTSGGWYYTRIRKNPEDEKTLCAFDKETGVFYNNSFSVKGELEWLEEIPTQVTECPSCGAPWDTAKNNACQCGAILKKTETATEPSTGMKELMIQFTEEVAYFYEIVGGGKGKDLIFEHVEFGNRSTTAELLTCFFEGIGMRPPSPQPPTGMGWEDGDKSQPPKDEDVPLLINLGDVDSYGVGHWDGEMFKDECTGFRHWPAKIKWLYDPVESPKPPTPVLPEVKEGETPDPAILKLLEGNPTIEDYQWAQKAILEYYRSKLSSANARIQSLESELAKYKNNG